MFNAYLDYLRSNLIDDADQLSDPAIARRALEELTVDDFKHSFGLTRSQALNPYIQAWTRIHAGLDEQDSDATAAMGRAIRALVIDAEER